MKSHKITLSESKFNSLVKKMVKESVKRVLNENTNSLDFDGYYKMSKRTIDGLVKEIEKDYNRASKPFYSRGTLMGSDNWKHFDSYMNSMTTAIANNFSKEEYIQAMEKFGLHFNEKAMPKFEKTWNYCINDLEDEIRREHEAWAEEQMSNMGFGFEGD